MKLKFLGTRGEIDARARLCRMHSSLEVSYRGRAVMIDCGADWLQRIYQMRPEAILLHACSSRPCLGSEERRAMHSLHNRTKLGPASSRLSVVLARPFHS